MYKQKSVWTIYSKEMLWELLFLISETEKATILSDIGPRWFVVKTETGGSLLKTQNKEDQNEETG